ncbi:hypothetical protein NLU13_8528 [Sarocladium strictum]|uniref:Uncharacterized protein n=1 Tax=Sarocladium strictum TaxID=5046 RepID=A0AA39GBV8_SARSR|nr:hypothetical protein NLU13_8528 [Sarocladium strictum]
MSSPELYTAFVAAINAREWQAAQAVLAPTVNVNSEDVPAEGLGHKVAPTMATDVTAPAGFDLLASYTSYVDCVQRGPVVEDFSKYCSERLVVNNQNVALEQFSEILEGAKGTFEEMHWNLVEAVVDEEKQQIATRVMLTGQPVRDFA